MKDNEILDIVKKVLSELNSETNIKNRIDLDTELFRDLNLDSLLFSNLILSMEEAFDVPIENDLLFEADLITVGDLVELIKKAQLAMKGA